ncbi:MAG: hypothetical protein JNJ89_06880 [Rubrivivax sp.]|nr:hypothetical protein [Rubrivivax sp.]
MKRVLSTLALAATLACGAALGATDAESPQGLLRGKLPDNAAALNRVAISSFFVQVVTDFGVEMKRSSNTFYSKVHNLSAEQLLPLADGLYTLLTQELAAAGIEVVAADRVAALAAMADLHKAGRQSPSVINDSTLKKISTLVAAKGLPIVLFQVQDQRVPKYFTDVPEGTYSNQLVNWEQQSREWLMAGNLETFGMVGILTAQQKLADELQATVLTVRLTVPLVDMGIERKIGFSGGDAGKVRPNPRLVEAGTVFSFAQAGGNPGHMAQQVLALQKPLPIQDVKFEVEAGAPRDGGGLIGALFGAARANTDKADFMVKVDAAQLQAGALAAATTLFKELAQTLAAAK